MTNPLLTYSSLPPFSTIRPEHVVTAVKITLQQCRNIVKKITAQPDQITWDNLCQTLAEANERLSRVWSPVSHLNAVQDSKELREAYEQSLPLLSEYNTWLGHNKGLYQAYRNLRDGQNYLHLSIAQKKSVDNALIDFELSGIKLLPVQQQRYGEIVARLIKLGAIYSNNVLDATMSWRKLITDKQLLSGIPKSALNIARAHARDLKKKGWLLTLDITSYLSVLTYCDNASLREECYLAYNTRASDQGPDAGKWDNGPIMNEILKLRYELAQLLGFNSYADQSLVTKMAQSPQQVLNFLTDLAKRSRVQGKKELAQLCIFAKRYFNHNKMELWDMMYYSEKQKQHLFSINDEQLRSYFPESRVISGLFEVITRIYGITVKERQNVETWHTDVRFYDLFDDNGKLRGSFYLDLYIRDNKRSGAWMDDCLDLFRKSNSTLQKPVAYITCNFNCPMNNQPALFTHSEITTLFHEFGHGLHHMLTDIDTPGVSGINGVPWDAVELPSQFMENYCWQPEVLLFISSHYKTCKSLPDKLLNNILKAKNYQAALFILRQLECSLFDLCIHYKYSSEQKLDILDTLAKVKKQVAVIPTLPSGRFPHTFSHIFAGGYAAGYYSYLWANVLAADAWSRFEEEGIFNRSTGQSFLDTILSRGGSEEPMVLFMRFRGREPELDAMLYHYGIK